MIDGLAWMLVAAVGLGAWGAGRPGREGWGRRFRVAVLFWAAGALALWLYYGAPWVSR